MENLNWNPSKLNDFFADKIKVLILQIQPSLDDDRWVWSGSTSGLAKPASVYRLRSRPEPVGRTVLQALWKLDVPASYFIREDFSYYFPCQQRYFSHECVPFMPFQSRDY